MHPHPQNWAMERDAGTELVGGDLPTLALSGTDAAWLLLLLIAAATVGITLLYRSAKRRSAILRELGEARAGSDLQLVSLAKANGTIRELKQALGAKDESLANTVHELRTPLTSIMAALDILHAAQASTDEDRAEFIEQGLVACRHLMFLLNDLLDHAAFEAGRLQMEIRDWQVADLIGDAVQIMRPWAIARQVGLEVEVPGDQPKVLGDRARVLQVIFNLLGNAMKFSPPDAKVILRAYPVARAVAFEIEDCGMGIPKESRARLFSRFGRAHGAETNAPKGTGIGLYMCKLLVDQMRGSIGFRDREGGPGSVFWFTLPSPVTVEQPLATTLDSTTAKG